MEQLSLYTIQLMKQTCSNLLNGNSTAKHWPEWSLHTSCQFPAAADQLSAWYWCLGLSSCRSSTEHTVNTTHNPVTTAKPAVQWWRFGIHTHTSTLGFCYLILFSRVTPSCTSSSNGVPLEITGMGFLQVGFFPSPNQQYQSNGRELKAPTPTHWTYPSLIQ